MQLLVYRYQVDEPSLDVVNVYTVKQMATWFHRNTGTKAYLGVIQLVKSKIVDTVLVISKDKEAGYDVEKTFHPNMPSCIEEVLDEFKHVFPTDLPLDLLLVQKGHEFRIDLEDMTTPVHKPIFKLSPLELEEAKKQIDSMLKHGYIRPSDSSFGSSVLFIPKKDGGL